MEETIMWFHVKFNQKVLLSMQEQQIRKSFPQAKSDCRYRQSLDKFHYYHQLEDISEECKNKKQLGNN
jgi:hypothetical protein